jgi:hypothetical protein
MTDTSVFHPTAHRNLHCPVCDKTGGVGVQEYMGPREDGEVYWCALHEILWIVPPMDLEEAS